MQNLVILIGKFLFLRDQYQIQKFLKRVIYLTESNAESNAEWQNRSATAKRQNNQQIKPKQKFLSPKLKFVRFLRDRFTSFYPNSDTPQITRTPNQTSITDFSHIPKVNIENIPGELTLAKFRNLILTELGNDIKVMVQNEIKEHLKNEKQPTQVFCKKRCS